MRVSAVTFNHLSFSYGSLSVLKDVSFEVARVEFIGIIGPNGGGKTTALKLMLGLLHPKAGKVQIFGSSPYEMRQKMGYVPQNNVYDKEFPISVIEVVLSGSLGTLNWRGRYPVEVVRKAGALMEEMGVEKLRNAPFGSLSGGQAQRVLIARSLMCDPEILFLDEPTANADLQSEEKIFHYLKALKGKKTILIVTHNFDAIVQNVERVLSFQHEVFSLNPKDLCEHFALGMYHRPQEPS